MNHTEQPQTLQPYVRAHRFESEPVLFACALVAVVMAISLWRPLPEPQQAAPADAPRTLAQAPSP